MRGRKDRAVWGTELVTGAILFLVAFPALGVAAVGEAGGQTLRQPLSARSAALGEACAAEDGRVEAIGYNPAGLGTLDRAEVGAMYHSGFAGDTFVSVLAGTQVGRLGVAGAVSYYSAGSVEWLDPRGQLTEVSAQRDLVAQVGAGFRVPRTTLSVGASGKVIHSELIEDISGTSLAADVGASLELSRAGLVFGVSAQNMGGSMRLEDGTAVLPLLLRLGLAYHILVDARGLRFGTMQSLGQSGIRSAGAPHRVIALAEYQARLQEDAAGFAVGAEYVYAGVLALRAGFRSLTRGAAARHDVLSLGIGVGLKPVRLDYSVEMIEFATLHRVSVTVASQPK